MGRGKTLAMDKMSNTSSAPDELSPEIWGPGLARIEALLGSMQSDLTTQCARANTILADLRRRVEVLEQRQGMGETKQIAKKGQARNSRKEG